MQLNNIKIFLAFDQHHITVSIIICFLIINMCTKDMQKSFVAYVGLTVTFICKGKSN